MSSYCMAYMLLFASKNHSPDIIQNIIICGHLSLLFSIYQRIAIYTRYLRLTKAIDKCLTSWRDRIQYQSDQWVIQVAYFTTYQCEHPSYPLIIIFIVFLLECSFTIFTSRYQHHIPFTLLAYFSCLPSHRVKRKVQFSLLDKS